MKTFSKATALNAAVIAAQAAGKVMRQNLHAAKKVNEATQHDMKLELDVRCQKLIERLLQKSHPHVALLGEEGVAGDPQAEYRWVVDPIDGTVNFAYGIPHACVSIALQVQGSALGVQSSKFKVQGRVHSPSTIPRQPSPYSTLLGVVYDPFCDELWTAIHGQPARLNGRIIRVSRHKRLAEAVIALGFSKSARILENMQPIFNQLVHRVRKLRIMGAGALDLAYVACGRFDGYFEPRVRLWDIAAGGLILECAGGNFGHWPLDNENGYRVIATNCLLHRQLAAMVEPGTHKT